MTLLLLLLLLGFLFVSKQILWSNKHSDLISISWDFKWTIFFEYFGKSCASFVDCTQVTNNYHIRCNIAMIYQEYSVIFLVIHFKRLLKMISLFFRWNSIIIIIGNIIKSLKNSTVIISALIILTMSLKCCNNIFAFFYRAILV